MTEDDGAGPKKQGPLEKTRPGRKGQIEEKNRQGTKRHGGRSQGPAEEDKTRPRETRLYRDKWRRNM